MLGLFCDFPQADVLNEFYIFLLQELESFFLLAGLTVDV